MSPWPPWYHRRLKRRRRALEARYRWVNAEIVRLGRDGSPEALAKIPRYNAEREAIGQHLGHLPE